MAILLASHVKLPSARLGLLKKLVGEEETTWNNYRKFQVDSKVVATQ
jgi:hypothetical protein